jgi:NDP-sugar pyrophosphorylase family protein
MAGTLPAMVISGGRGTRLREVTRDRIPKALVTVGGRTLLDRTLDLLQHAGIEDVVLVLAHHGAQIERHMLSHPRRSMHVRIVCSDPPRGIIQDLTAACETTRIEGPCWMMGCDELFDTLDLDAARRLHDERQAVVTTLVARGVAMVDRSVDALLADDGRVTALLPPAEEPDRCSVIGISLLSPAFLARARALSPTDAASDRDRLVRQLLPALIAEGAFYGAVVTPSYYFHAGTPAALARAEAHLASRRHRAGEVQAQHLQAG